MANETVTLDGTNYLRFPIKDAFYPQDSINVDFDLTLRNWTQPHSGQIIGNFDNQGYGVFYQNGIEEISDFTILDCGNSHLFHFNQDSALISQRNFPDQTNSVVITAQTIDHFGNKYYYDSNNNKVFRLDSNNILQNEFSLQGTDFDVKIINVNSVGNVFFLNIAETTILEYTSQGAFVGAHDLDEAHHNNFAINSQDEIVTHITKQNTPMLFDCEDNFYTVQGINLRRNGLPFFYIGPSANTFGIDVNDNIWIVHDGNKMIKMTKQGKILFNKEFHEITPCEPDECNINPEFITLNFTRELTDDGFEDYAWVLLGKSNYALKLNSNADIVTCVLLTNLLDSERYPDALFENIQFCNNGDFTSFRHKKTFSLNCSGSNNSQIVARVAIQDTCDGFVTIKSLFHDVTSFSGSHNVKFFYNGIDGQGKLFVDGKLVDSFTQEGVIYYDTGNHKPTLIGADSGNFRSKKEELGIQDPVYLRGLLSNITLSRNIENFSSRNFRIPSIKMEFPTPYPLSYKENVDKLFLFRSNGYISPKFNINIKDSGFTTAEDQEIISNEVFDIIEEQIPVQNTLNKLDWSETLTIKELIETL